MKKKIAFLLAFVMIVSLCVVGTNKSAYARQAQMFIELPEEIKKEQEIQVRVCLDSDVNLYSVDAYIEYNADLLEFIPENDVVTGADGVLEIKDTFGEETKQKEFLLTFRTLDVGQAYMNLTQIYLIDYQDLDYITVAPVEHIFDIQINNEVAQDARLSDLLVAPGDLTEPFDPNKLNYEMHVGMDVDSIGVSAYAAEEDSVVDLNMPEYLVEGENRITITVTALSGNVNVYTIRVIKGDWQDETLEEAVDEDVEDTTETTEENVTELPSTETATETTTEAITETTTETGTSEMPESTTEDVTEATTGESTEISTEQDTELNEGEQPEDASALQ